MDDKEFSKHSMKCGSVVTASNEEVYKRISEDNLLPPLRNSHEAATNPAGVSLPKVEDKQVTPVPRTENGDTKMVQEENAINDGADEEMLGAEDNEKLAEKRDEVKFIRGDHQNGDAKIDIGQLNGKTFTGMTKDELMKYANDPFWVRLRWIFFIAFWAIWLGMLVGAILIIIDAPKCAAPPPLPWFKQGPHAKFNALEMSPDDLALVQKLHATGAIYELPADLTYNVKDPEVEKKIKQIVATYKDADVNVILDITPNYVKKDSEMMKNALADETKQSAFIWIEKAEVPNNWRSLVNGSAWATVKEGNHVLSQFGDGLYDLHMNDTIVKKALSEVLKHLIGLGVRGIRFRNSKFFLLTKNIEDETPDTSKPNFLHDQYGFWTHSQTTFQDGLGDVLYEYLTVVKNASADAFLSVADDVVRPEVYKTRDGTYGIDIPMYGNFTHSLSVPKGRNLQAELQNIMLFVGNDTWLQWNFADVVWDGRIEASAFSLFVALMPGVPVIPANAEAFRNVSSETYKHIERLRLSHSYMHGDFDMYGSEQLVAYARIKSGNPGYFVIFNPTDVTHTGNFTHLGLPDKMTVDAISQNWNVTDISVKSKVSTDQLVVSPYSTVIFTYVPVKTG